MEPTATQGSRGNASLALAPRLRSGPMAPMSLGATAPLVISVLNASRLVDHIEVNVTGPGSVVVTPPSATVALLPQQDEAISFLITPIAPGPVVLHVEARSSIGAPSATDSVHVLVVPSHFGQAASPARAAPEQPRPSSPGSERFRLLSDHPVARDGDRLGAARVAQQLADIVLSTGPVTPFCIGIQGGWGSGKSSLMQQLRQQVEEQAEGTGRLIRVVWFNAWTAEGANALPGLVRTVLEQLDPRLLRPFVRRLRAASWLSVPFLVAASWLGLRHLADDVWDRFAVDAAQRNEVREEVHRVLGEWVDAEVSLGGGRLLVVFVDDLDRCSPENVLQVFEAIRLYLDAPGLVFVIGYDHNVISDALLRAREFPPGSTSRTYLEKIIQVDYSVPVPDIPQATRLAMLSAQWCGVEDLLEDADLDLVVQRSGRNPRRFKRFLNTFVLSRQLDQAAEALSPTEHLKVLLLRMYFPDLFRSLITEPERDVLGQLIELVRLRRAVAAGNELQIDAVRWLYEACGVAPPKDGESLDAALRRLEEHLPDLLVELARDPELFSLAWSLGDREERSDLLRRANSRIEPAPTSESEGTGRGAPSATVRRCPECGDEADARRHSCRRCGTSLWPGDGDRRSLRPPAPSTSS